MLASWSDLIMDCVIESDRQAAGNHQPTNTFDGIAVD
ncbi:MAG: hypothetical protein ACJASX_003786 [Limisphaerales bacterium]|jgi:hypothetical protein